MRIVLHHDKFQILEVQNLQFILVEVQNMFFKIFVKKKYLYLIFY